MNALTPEGRALFLELVDLPPAARAQRLDELAGTDAALADQVAGLLAADAAAEGFLEPPSLARLDATGPDEDDDDPHVLVGRRIGQYTLGPRIGMGGMGTVYVAEQDRPKRKVALKLLRTSYATPNLRRRFEREAEILGRLRHPGIAEIYEAGTHVSELGPIPYFALEYIPEARTLTQFADDEGLDARARVQLLARACDAVAEAHRHGIVHRDIKPSNLLIGSDGVPKLIDFGIARWLDDPDAAGTIATQLGELLGTLYYMSPEQFDGTGPGPTAASDVYSLGVVAYELVTGRLPYPVTRANASRISELVRTHVPESITRADVRWRALDDILQMALAKAPADRYPDAAELAADLRRASSGEPVRARGSRRLHQVRTWAWRSRRAVPWLAVAGIATAAFFVGRRETIALPAPVAPARVADADAYRHHIAAAERALAANDMARAKAELDDCAGQDRGWEWARLRAQVDRSVQTVALGAPAHLVRYDAERHMLVATTEDGKAHGVRVVAGEPFPTLEVAWAVDLGDEAIDTAIDPARGLVWIGGASGRVHRRRVTDGGDAGDLGSAGPAIVSLTLVDAGRVLVVSRSGRTLERWELETGVRRSTVTVAHELTSLASLGATVLGAWEHWGIDEVDVQDGSILHTYPATEGVEAILAEGDTVYAAGWDDRITAYDREGHGQPRRWTPQPDGLVDLVMPDPDTIASAGRDGAITTWDRATGTVRDRLRGHDFGVEGIVVGGDGR